MIKILNQAKETANHDNVSILHLFHNTEHVDSPPHWHAEIEIIMPVLGSYDITVRNIDYQLNPGDVTFISSGEIHSLRPPSNGECIILQFDSWLLYSLEELETTVFMLPSAIVISKSNSEPRLYEDISRLMNKLIKEYGNSKMMNGPLVYSFLIQIYVRLCRENIYKSNNLSNTASARQQENMETFVRTCNYINQHYNENLTLENVADVTGFSKFYFSRLFKQLTNTTFNEYLTQYRIKRAKELLSDTSMSIADTAMNSGFSSLSNFNRAFRIYNSCSPTEYRKKRKEILYDISANLVMELTVSNWHKKNLTATLEMLKSMTNSGH